MKSGAFPNTPLTSLRNTMENFPQALSNVPIYSATILDTNMLQMSASLQFNSINERLIESSFSSMLLPNIQTQQRQRQLQNQQQQQQQQKHMQFNEIEEGANNQQKNEPKTLTIIPSRDLYPLPFACRVFDLDQEKKEFLSKKNEQIFNNYAEENSYQAFFQIDKNNYCFFNRTNNYEDKNQNKNQNKKEQILILNTKTGKTKNLSIDNHPTIKMCSLSKKESKFVSLNDHQQCKFWEIGQTTTFPELQFTIDLSAMPQVNSYNRSFNKREQNGLRKCQPSDIICSNSDFLVISVSNDNQKHNQKYNQNYDDELNSPQNKSGWYLIVINIQRLFQFQKKTNITNINCKKLSQINALYTLFPKNQKYALGGITAISNPIQEHPNGHIYQNKTINNSNFIACSDSNYNIHIWNLNNGLLYNSFNCKAKKLTAISFMKLHNEKNQYLLLTFCGVQMELSVWKFTLISFENENQKFKQLPNENFNKKSSIICLQKIIFQNNLIIKNGLPIIKQLNKEFVILCRIVPNNIFVLHLSNDQSSKGFDNISMFSMGNINNIYIHDQLDSENGDVKRGKGISNNSSMKFFGTIEHFKNLLEFHIDPEICKPKFSVLNLLIENQKKLENLQLNYDTIGDKFNIKKNKKRIKNKAFPKNKNPKVIKEKKTKGEKKGKTVGKKNKVKKKPKNENENENENANDFLNQLLEKESIQNPIHKKSNFKRNLKENVSELDFNNKGGFSNYKNIKEKSSQRNLNNALISKLKPKFQDFSQSILKSLERDLNNSYQTTSKMINNKYQQREDLHHQQKKELIDLIPNWIKSNLNQVTEEMVSEQASELFNKNLEKINNVGVGVGEGNSNDNDNVDFYNLIQRNQDLINNEFSNLTTNKSFQKTINSNFSNQLNQNLKTAFQSKFSEYFIPSVENSINQYLFNLDNKSKLQPNKDSQGKKRNTKNNQQFKQVSNSLQQKTSSSYKSINKQTEEFSTSIEKVINLQFSKLNSEINSTILSVRNQQNNNLKYESLI
ncbi:serine/threonine-protein kinase ste7 [Anaeramoeba flamelloides]|uniref:Serine/threonine-protein kinase ste7 n=1 Tax=Anaeramoeba flamelloides TaxID=1746091 RepID=A0ABQ8YDQ7_9EUKA|nr:serine/threonine-protein kinase ste7 [Anaeramoeba flamelloides]